jgi:hypothetical protein
MRNQSWSGKCTTLVQVQGLGKVSFYEKKDWKGTTDGKDDVYVGMGWEITSREMRA